ncbi:MAG TPA: ATP-binding protein [Nitrospirota bacterium]
MRGRLFTRILLAYLALAAIAAPFLWYFLSRSIEGFFIDRMADGLRAQARLIANDIPRGGRLDNLVASYKISTGSRVTIIGPDGSVLGDSDDNAAQMENHLLRPEVQSALVNGWGSATRYSRTLKIDMLYVAVPAEGLRGGKGFIRLSMPLHDVEAAMAGIKRRVAAGAFLMFLASVLLGVYISRRITDVIGEMAAFTRGVAAGGSDRRLMVRRVGELGLLADNLNDMAGQLRDRMEAITVEKITLEAVLGGMVEGVLVADAEGRVMVANARLREAFGLGMEDPLGRPFLEVIRNRELAHLVSVVHEGKAPASGEAEVQFPEKRAFMANCVPLSVNGVFSGTALVLHDVTRLKALEVVRRDFVANVSHELKTPVAAIQGFSETLLAGALDDKENARRFVGIIEKNSRRLARLVEDLLTLSKIELGEIELDLKPVRLADVYADAAALLGPRIADRRLTMLADIPEGLSVLADQNMLYQAVLNVLDNAVKYAREGGRVSVRAAYISADKVELTITDDGPGIPADLIPRIGERFFRVDAGRSRDLGGTGLGLAIVKHLVNAHGGTLVIGNSPNNGGTSVKLTFNAPAIQT